MRLSRAGDYGLRIVLELARREPGATVSARELSQMQDVPQPFLAKVVGRLVEAGLLETRRGVAGGASLARDAGDITVLDVVEAVEGPIILNECLLEDEPCDRVAICPMHDVWESAQALMREELAAADFAALARMSQELQSAET